MKKRAIILMNMGGARSAAELKTFITNMFHDKRIMSSPFRKIFAFLFANLRYKKVWKKYKLIEGSRIYQITESLVQKIQKHTDAQVLYSMRYTHPVLQEVIHSFDDVVLIPLYPHYSTTTVESHLDELKATYYQGKFQVVPPFYQESDFNRLIISNILASVVNPTEWHLIFSAHGLPEKIIKKGDPYQQQIEEHVRLLSKELQGFQSISLAYQSRLGPIRWLQPYLHKHLKNYKGKKVVIYPLSFMIDNSETDYELQIEYAEIARKIGIQKYLVVPCPNDTKALSDFVLKLVDQSKKPDKS